MKLGNIWDLILILSSKTHVLCGDAGGNGNGWQCRLVPTGFSDCGSSDGGDDNNGGRDGDGGDDDSGVSSDDGDGGYDGGDGGDEDGDDGGDDAGSDDGDGCGGGDDGDGGDGMMVMVMIMQMIF